METETCDHCGEEVQNGELVRDSADSALLYCRECIVKIS